MTRPAGVVLTGGRSRRMGTDKAFVEVDGRPMVIAVADALWEAGCQPVECQGGDLDGLAGLGLFVVADDEPDGGPVAALAAASRRHDGPIVVAACDLPHLDAGAVGAVVAAGTTADRPAVAVANGRHHLVVYAPAGAFAGVPAHSTVREMLDRLGAVDAAVDPATVRNVNTPDDL